MLPYMDKKNPWSSHSIISRWMKEIAPNSLVIDIGAASGTLGRFCQGMGLRLLGIEPNVDWAEMARPFYQDMYIGDVQTVPNEYLTGASAVVCADLLEHLPDPRAVLTRLVDQAESSCRFMISVPNVANIWIRLSLLFGHFDYNERGILDRTHLRFFTRDSFFVLLHDAGLRIQRFEVTPLPLDLVNPFFEQKALGRRLYRALARLTGLLPTLFGYQFVVLAIKERG